MRRNRELDEKMATAGSPLDLCPRAGKAISAKAEFCKRVRFRQSDCQNCTDICPDAAITLDMGPHVDDTCTRCGLCVNACPTEVFHPGVDLVEYFSAEFQSAVGDGCKTDGKGTFQIHCQNAEKHSEESHRVACLGNITEQVMLAGALSGLGELVLTSGCCSRCRLARGETQLQGSMATFRALEHSLGVEGFCLRREERPARKPQQARLSRRALFASS